eukprot:492782-Alexandrium_andersonii.AAC.1
MHETARRCYRVLEKSPQLARAFAGGAEAARAQICAPTTAGSSCTIELLRVGGALGQEPSGCARGAALAVSYTHLTLPTICSV